MDIRNWFKQYVWNSKKGKAGFVLAVAVPVLDNYTRIETAVRAVMTLPALAQWVHFWWVQLLLIFSGLGLIYWSSLEGKGRPVPKTLEERMDELESLMWIKNTPSAPKRQLLYEGSYDSDETFRDMGKARLGRIRNNQPGMAENVTVKIEYLHEITAKRHTIPRARWIVHKQLGRALLDEDSASVDLESGAAQSFVIVLAEAGSVWISENLASPLAALQEGRWTAKLVVSADRTQPIEETIKFAVFPGGKVSF